MQVLLDENLPRQFGKLLIGHQVITVQQMGWAGIKNGRLISTMVEAGVHCLISVDKGLAFQQNYEQSPVSIIILRARSNKLEHLAPFIPILHEVLLNPHKPGPTFLELPTSID